MTEISYRNQRIAVLSVVAYVTVLICIGVTVWMTDISDYAQGVITLVLGKYLSYADQVYAFDFNTTRASGIKDSTISTLSTTIETTKDKEKDKE